MATKLTFLGTGSADALRYYQTCFVVSNGNGENLLVDAGGGGEILRQLHDANIPLEQIRHIFITHKHLDHFWGLFWILRFLGSKIAKGKAQDLHIYASETIIGIIKEISPLFLKEKVTGLYDDKILFHPIDNGEEISINEWTLRPVSVESEKGEQFGFILSYDGKRLVFGGDEPLRGALLASAQDAKYLIHDAFCLEKDRERYRPQEIGHSTVKDAAQTAQTIRAKNLILVHTEDATFGERKSLYTQEAREFFDGNVIVPDDLEVVEMESEI